MPEGTAQDRSTEEPGLGLGLVAPDGEDASTLPLASSTSNRYPMFALSASVALAEIVGVKDRATVPSEVDTLGATCKDPATIAGGGMSTRNGSVAVGPDVVVSSLTVNRAE